MKKETEKIELCSEHHVHDHSKLPVLPNEDVLYHIADLFKVFGDATRIRILYTLSYGELCVCDIADVLGMTQSAISHQLRILKEKHLVKFRRDGKTIYYSLADSHVETILRQGYDHVTE
ncbi:MAG: metalloregulator ArsR/SmtB family transcription factor [Eubacteriales bacterium]|nr:metalloregulator ArsR/SmtB family transcription factor [Eubacteriales bacterium]